MADRIRAVFTPALLVKLSAILFAIACVGWPATHVLVLLTKPPELASWTGHLLLAISWLAILLTCLDFIATADVRKEQDDDDG